MAARLFRVEYDAPNSEPIGLSFVARDDEDSERRFTAWFSPVLAIHYGELLRDLGRRAIDLRADPDEEA